MVLEKVGAPLVLKELPTPIPKASEVLIKVEACAVCRTDLHVYDGDLSEPKLPLIMGHQIVGIIVAVGKKVANFKKGDIVGIPWLGATCKKCKYCKKNRENLCENAEFTGYIRDGGFAQYTVAEEDYCFAMPEEMPPAKIAPLLCAGLIGYRTLKMAGNAQSIGVYGFGAAAHIVAQIIIEQKRKFYAFTRMGDTQTQEFARKLGACWAGGSEELPPEKLDAALIFAPVGKLVPLALEALDKGGIVVCGGIHMSDIPSFPYQALWEERSICSVANLTRKDGKEFFELISNMSIKTNIQTYALEKANEALDDLRNGKFDGAAVLTM